MAGNPPRKRVLWSLSYRASAEVSLTGGVGRSFASLRMINQLGVDFCRDMPADRQIIGLEMYRRGEDE